MKNKNFKKRIKNLYKRWNIELPSEAEKFKEFKNRVLLILDSVLAEEFIKNKNLEDQFLKLIGKYYPRPIYWAISISFFKKFEDSSIYKVFSEETNFFKFIKYLQVIFWLDIEEELKNTLYVELKDAIEISLLDIEIRKTKDGEIILYPKGAKLLDEGLINDVLDWIKEKPKVYKNFKNALEKYLNKKY